MFFSEATYNREHKKITANMLPTLRTVVPVYYHNKLFGMVVINANYPLLLEKKFTEIAPAKNTLVTNHAGDYASYDATSKQITFEFHDRYTRNVPEFVSTVKDTSQKEQSFFLNDEVAYAVKINPTPNTQDAFLAIVLSSPKKILLKEAYKTQYETLILAGFITILGILVSALVARRLTSPLQRMASSMINSKGQVANDLAFPSHLRNEIENLSHVFDSLTKNLQQSEAKASDVLNNVIDGIITINKNGIIESYNPACEKIFGYSTQEVIGQNVKMLMPEPYHSEHDQYIKNYKDTGKEKVIGIGREVTGKRKDGSEFPLDLSVSKTWTSGTYIFTGIVRDITERKQMEQMKDEFISTVNHELRTPLTSIQAALGLLKTKTQGKLEKKELRLITLSYNNSKRLSCLVNDILDIEKIAAGKMDYHFEELEIGALVKDIINRHQNLAEKYHIIFSLNLDIPETYCKLDSSRFNQALVNLLSNAAKFSPKGEIVTITVEKHGTANLCVSVTDKGPGVPVDFHSKIFKRFAQADSSSTRAKGGTGLGLNITKSIIEASGGTVAFDSEEGKGARFYFILPICHSEQSQEVG